MAEVLSDQAEFFGKFVAGPRVDRRPVVMGPDQATQEMTLDMTMGVEAAFNRFHEHYFDRLFRYLIVVTRGDEQAALDAVQETVVRVAKHIRCFEREDVFWSWLTVLARSAARDGARRRQSYLRMLAGYAQALFGRPSTDSAARNADANLRASLDAAMAALPPLDQRLIEGKYFAAKSVSELAEETKLTNKAVESRLLRARRVIKEQMLLLLDDEE